LLREYSKYWNYSGGGYFEIEETILVYIDFGNSNRCLYRNISTTFIKEKAYLKQAWDESIHNKHIINWQKGEVSINSLQEERIKELSTPKPNTFAKINRGVRISNPAVGSKFSIRRRCPSEVLHH
jgi:hypothetical protein